MICEGLTNWCLCDVFVCGFFLVFFIEAYAVGTHLNCIVCCCFFVFFLFFFIRSRYMYMACNLKTTKFLDCVLIGVCAVNGSNTVSPVASWPGIRINPQWLELPISRTNFHGPKGVWVIDVQLYILVQNFAQCESNPTLWCQGQRLRIFMLIFSSPIRSTRRANVVTPVVHVCVCVCVPIPITLC